jgi:hypothetical protein
MVPGIEAAKTTTSRWAMKGYGGIEVHRESDATLGSG